MSDVKPQNGEPRKRSPMITCAIAGVLAAFCCIALTVFYFGWTIVSNVQEISETAAPACPPDLSPPADMALAYSMDGAIYLANADGSGRTRLTPDSMQIDPFTFGLFGLVWSADGAKIYFYDYTGQYYAMNADGTGLSQTSDDTVPGATGLSPDGRQKVFIEDGVLFVSSANGSDKQMLMDIAEDRVNGYPDWSPDGSKIAFLRYYPGAGGLDPTPSYYHLFTIRPDGSDLKDINDSTVSFSWSPDGKRISIVDEPHNLLVMNSDGGDLMRITDISRSADGSDAAWSPDGAWLAFTTSAEDSGNGLLTIANSACMGVWVMPDTSYSNSPAWRPAHP